VGQSCQILQSLGASKGEMTFEAAFSCQILRPPQADSE
jgi:hypothetical protein